MSNLLKDKTIVIVFDHTYPNILTEAASVYEKLKELGYVSIYATDQDQLSIIRNSGHDFVYLFLYDETDGKDIPKPSEQFSMYHLHDWFDYNHYSITETTGVLLAVVYWESVFEGLNKQGGSDELD